MRLTARGVLVRGARPLDQQKKLSQPDAFLDLLDTKGGASLWPKPFMEMKHDAIAPFLVVGDTAYLGDPEQALARSEEHTSELQSLAYLVCRLLLEKKKKNTAKARCIAYA